MSDLLAGISVATVLVFVAQMVRISVPYALAAVGGTMSERGGVINIALEGMLLLGALGYTLGAYWTGNAWLGLGAAALAGVLTAAVHAIVTIGFKADQITSALGINLAAVGLSKFLLKEIFGSSSNSSRVAGLPTWELPGLSSIPGLGDLFGSPLVWLAALLVVLAHVVLFRTPFGLRLRSVGEHPEAAATLGLSISRLRTAGVLLSGMLAGLGGAWLASDQRLFTDGMSGGRGYIALAAMIVGKWNPLGAAAACLLFGFCETLQIRLQGGAIPNEFLQMLPYLVTMIVLAGVIGRAHPPAAVGKPYEPEAK
ncbi:MAG: ABC transporter permease [Candidatus Eiseniibacteriota bacterium]